MSWLKRRGCWMWIMLGLTFSMLGFNAYAQMAKVQAQASNLPEPSLQIDFDEQSLAKLGALYPGGRQIEFVEGRLGRPAARFFGMDRPGVIQIPNRPELKFIEGASYDIWAKIDKSEGMGAFGEKRQQLAWAMAIFAKAGDRMGFGFLVQPFNLDRQPNVYGMIQARDQTWNTNACDVTSDFSGVAIGEWFRITLVISNKRGIKIYLNKHLHVDCLNVRPNFNSSNSQDLFIGRYKEVWYPFFGSIQELKIYAIALTPEQVQALP